MSQRLSRRLRAAALALVFAGSAHAQYKWIDEEGRVSYSDRMPPAGARLLSAPPGMTRLAGGGEGNLPYALRASLERYPVTIYTTPSCAPCEMGRAHLNKRGIPFSERQITKPEDLTAVQRLGLAGTMLPGLGVGRDITDGFEPGTWDRLLDAAGYPKTSVLPARNQRPAVNPVAARQPAHREAAANEPASLAAAPADNRAAQVETRSAPADGNPGTAFSASGGAPFLLPAMPRAETAGPAVRF